MKIEVYQCDSCGCLMAKDEGFFVNVNLKHPAGKSQIERSMTLCEACSKTFFRNNQLFFETKLDPRVDGKIIDQDNEKHAYPTNEMTLHHFYHGDVSPVFNGGKQ